MNDTMQQDLTEFRAQLAENRMGIMIVKMVREAMNDPANRAEFEQWYFEKHGKKYVW